MTTATSLRAGVLTAVVAIVAVVAGCGEPTNERRIERLEDDVHDLEERIEELEGQLE